VHFRASLHIGKKNIKVRLYDKALEIKQKSNKTWFFDVWNLKKVPDAFKIIRIEFQLRREVLKEFDINSVHDLFRLIQNIWSYCTVEWLKFQDNPGKQSHQRETLPWWKKIQNGFNDTLSGQPLIRAKASKADKDKISQQTIGLLSSFAVLAFGSRTILKPNSITIHNTMKEFHKYLNENGITDKIFQEKILDKNAKYRRLNEKFFQTFKKREELGFFPNNAA